MIRINLLGDKKDYSMQYFSHLVVATGALFATIFFCIVTYTTADSGLESLQTEKSRLEKELVALKKETKEVSTLEEKRKTLQEKLTTIATLKAKKHGPIHILSGINESIPEKAWLLEMKEYDGAVTMTGIAIDNQTVAEFMGKLSASKYIRSVDLNQTKQVEIEGVKLSEFSIRAELQDLLKVAAGKTDAQDKKTKES